jgi:hypothetical protein
MIDVKRAEDGWKRCAETMDMAFTQENILIGLLISSFSCLSICELFFNQ